MRTASPTEAVFSPPYLPDPTDRTRRESRPPTPSEIVEPFPEPTLRRQPTALPPATRSRELPRPQPPMEAVEPPRAQEPSKPVELPPKTPRPTELPRTTEAVRPIELPPPRTQDTARETDRTEPGTWREILARFERELGPLTDPDDAETSDDVVSSTGAPAQSEADADVTMAGADDNLAGAVPGDHEGMGVSDVPGADDRDHAMADATAGGREDAADDAGVDDEVGAELTDPSDVDSTTPAEPVEPGAPTYLDEPMPWEVGAMTTPGYTPPASIHDAQHDAWPVDAEDGNTIPAWSDESVSERDDAAFEDANTYEEINELLLEEEVPVDPWDVEPEPDEPDSRSDFPLDAFIVPAGVQHAPAGYDAAVAQRVAHRLDEMARRLRDGGLATLGSTDSVDELSRVLAAIVTGYVAHVD